MEIPIWKQTMLTPDEYAKYANLSIKIIYDYCHKRKIPCMKTGRGEFKIHRVSADEALRDMAMTYEGHERMNVPKRRKSIL